MRQLILFFLIIQIVLAPIPNRGDMTTPPKSVEHQFFNSKNLLKDPGFEMGKSTRNWVASGGTYSVFGTAPLSGARQGNWDSSSASQTLTSNAVAISSGYGLSLQNIVGACSIKVPTGTATHTLEVYDGTNILSTTTVISSTKYSRVSANAVAPTSGNVYLRLKSINANEPAIDIDDCYLGLADGYNLSQVSQAQFAGSGYFATTAACAPLRTNTALGAFTADADCPGPTIEASQLGTWATTDVDLPKWTVSNLPAGVYKVDVDVQLNAGSASQVICAGVSDGTTTSPGSCATADASGADGYPTHIVGYFSYTTAGSRTFEVYGASTSGSVALGMSSALRNVRFFVTYYPLSSQTAYTADQVAWRVDANISGANFDLGTSNQATYVSMTNGSVTMTQNTGSATVQIPCSTTNPPTGLTCSAGTEDNGVSFTIPQAGAYRACTTFQHLVSNQASGEVTAAFQIIETPTNAQTISQEGKERQVSGQSLSNLGYVYYPHRLCGTFEFASAGQKVLRLMYEQSITATVGANRVDGSGASVGQHDIHWEVYPLNQQIPAPILVNSVMNSSSGTTRTEVANINCDASSSIVSQHGAWVTAIGNVASGNCAVTITTGIFSASPYCVVSETNNTSDLNLVGVKINSATSLTVRTETDAGISGTATDMILMCTGAK